MTRFLGDELAHRFIGEETVIDEGVLAFISLFGVEEVIKLVVVCYFLLFHNEVDKVVDDLSLLGLRVCLLEQRLVISCYSLGWDSSWSLLYEWISIICHWRWRSMSIHAFLFINLRITSITHECLIALKKFSSDFWCWWELRWRNRNIHVLNFSNNWMKLSLNYSFQGFNHCQVLISFNIFWNRLLGRCMMLLIA